MENFHTKNSNQTTFSPSSLLCEESMLSLDQVGIDEGKRADDDDDHDDVYVQMLLDKEEITSPAAAPDHLPNNAFRQSRLEAIHYMLSAKDVFGFKLQTAYLSVTYLDKFLSRRPIDGEKAWAIRLLAMACLSLAAKMEELAVPALPDLPMEEYHFESRVIHKMELLVLSTLDWRLKSVTPFEFIGYFVSRFYTNSPPNQNIKSRITQLIMRMIEAVNLMSYKPSGITAAATLMTLDPRLSREAMELILNGSTSWRPLNIIEDVWPCYQELQGLDMERSIKSLKCIISPPFSPTQLQNTKALGSSTSIPAVGAKRKRLGFDDCDQDCDKA